MDPAGTSHRPFDPATLSGQERYQLLTSLVVPRPIGWISTWSAEGVANLAPFSFFAALAASPMLVGVSVGHRPQGPKDTLVNVRARGAFCVNVVTAPLLEAMNATSAEVGGSTASDGGRHALRGSRGPGPVGRLWGAAYAMPGEVRIIPRPR